MLRDTTASADAAAAAAAATEKGVGFAAAVSGWTAGWLSLVLGTWVIKADVADSIGGSASCTGAADGGYMAGRRWAVGGPGCCPRPCWTSQSGSMGLSDASSMASAS